MTNNNEPVEICVVGAGASGVGLIWALAMAQRLGHTTDQYNITVVHNQSDVGGHSISQEVVLDGKTVHVDCGVQLLAPKMYPATLSMLALPDFVDTVKTEPLPLKIACIYPPKDGVDQYWGNFPEYQSTELFESGKHDAEVFAELVMPRLSASFAFELRDSLAKLLDNNVQEFANQKQFVTYFLDGYMSIMNGYGNALVNEVLVADIVPLWDFGYASFTEEVTGYARFTDGADSWVRQMWKVATDHFGDNLTGCFDANVEKIYPSDAGPTVVWADEKGSLTPRSFDIVVSSVDMHTNSTLLNVPENALWSEVFEPSIGSTTGLHVETAVWPLLPGYCALHQDPTVLAQHSGPSRLETLQFNGQVGAIDGGPKFDLLKSFSTYIVSNLMGIPGVSEEDDYYLTMYGYDPGEDKPKNIRWESSWNHGMWLPTFMVPQKMHFHRAQSVSKFHKPQSSQQDTGIFFAGNNLTMDSEEGALMSGMAIAKYAFGVDPIACLEANGSDSESLLLAGIEFDVIYDFLMFPSKLEELLDSGVDLVEHFLEHWLPIWRTGHGDSRKATT